MGGILPHPCPDLNTGLIDGVYIHKYYIYIYFFFDCCVNTRRYSSRVFSFFSVQQAKHPALFFVGLLCNVLGKNKSDP